MKQQSVHCLLLIAMMGVGLAGCHSDVNLKEVTVDSTAKAKLSLPVGEVTTSFGNMIGLFGKTADIIINDKGLLELHVSEKHVRDFHEIVLTDYIGKVEEDVLLSPMGISTLAKGYEQNIPVPLSITFDGVNDDLSDERLDSMVIDTARFTTRISVKSLGISETDIKKVTLKLGPQFRRAKGTDIELPDFHLDTDVPIMVDNFTLVMMKNENAAPGNDNVINTAGITFIITLKTGEDVAVSAGSAFHFSFEVELLTYKALYGYFKPDPKETSDESTVDVPIKLPGNEPFILPSKDPEIEMTFTYSLSMPLRVYFYYIQALHPNDEITPAQWDGGSTDRLEPLQNILAINAPLDASVQSSILLDKTIKGGTIDRFFLKEVTGLAYKYDLLIDDPMATLKDMKQFRMTQNRNFVMDFLFKMPFEFNPGLDAAYVDTIKDVHLERASLDSLAAMTGGIITKIDSAELTLYLVINNEIPVDLQLDAEFLDEDNQPLNLKPLKNIKIDGARMTSITDITPQATTVTVPVHTEDFDEIAKTRSIRIRVHLGEEAETKTKQAAFPAKSKLSIKVGIAGNVQAALNLELNNQSNNK